MTDQTDLHFFHFKDLQSESCARLHSLQIVAEPLHEDDEEPPEAGVHVHRDPSPEGDGADRLDRVHRAVRVLRRRAQNLGRNALSSHRHKRVV